MEKDLLCAPGKKNKKLLSRNMFTSTFAFGFSLEVETVQRTSGCGFLILDKFVGMRKNAGIRHYSYGAMSN
jgi:hypothetical protein